MSVTGDFKLAFSFVFWAAASVLFAVGVEANLAHYGDEPWADIMFVGACLVLMLFSLAFTVKSASRMADRPRH